MKLLILAAGQGSRLRPLTDDRPKCMVEYKNKPIIDYILEATSKIKDKNIVCGYKKELLKRHLRDKDINFFNNNEFESSNMVYSMLCAKDIFDDELIVSYADIIYPKSFIDKLCKNKADIAILADKNWYSLWAKRFEDVLDDCETFKYDKDFNVYEIGKKSEYISDTMAGYIGLIKFSKSVLDYIGSLNIDKNMYMTDLLQLLLKKFETKVVLTDAPWLEIDDLKDIEIDVCI